MTKGALVKHGFLRFIVLYLFPIYHKNVITYIQVRIDKDNNVVRNAVVKKTEYDELVAKVNNIDTSGFVLKTKYDTDKSELEKKIPDTSGRVKKTDYNTRITEIEGKIPDVTNLATKNRINYR